MTDIVITGLCKRFGDKAVLRDLSAVLPGGETTCIMGPSGCGKTTLLRILMGLLAPDSGSVTGLPRTIAAVFQEDRLCEDLTAAANVRLVTGRAVPPAEIEAHLRALGLGDSLGLPVREYSGGMKRRAALARAVLAESELLVLDEPFKGLDEAARAAAEAYLLAHSQGKTRLIVTHDRAEAARLGGGVLRLGE